MHFRGRWWRVIGGLALGGVACGGSDEAGDGTGASRGPEGTVTYVVTSLNARAISRVDLLLVIDSSEGMLHKQRLLAEAMPALIARFATPRCLDPSGKPTGENAAIVDGAATCDAGAPEIAPVTDLHVAVISASLGDHGGDYCEAGLAPKLDDRAELLPLVRAGLPSWDDSGFLVWDPSAATAHDPAGSSDLAALGADLSSIVAGAGDEGCWHQAPLEAWYRFLVDPEPIVDLSNDGQSAVRGAVNQALLAQRQAFLRPDSLLGILMLSQQNDCSVIDEGGAQGFLVGYSGGSTWHMPRASSSCRNPNDACCRPCSAPARAGCPVNDADAGCLQGPLLSTNEDSMRLRCLQQRQRFGIDLLYPTGRYVDALTSPIIHPRLETGSDVVNPLFAGGGAGGRRRVVLGGIVGVPWQDIATPESLEDDASLAFMSAGELIEHGRWDVILGDAEVAVLPTDPLMVESMSPRPSGTPHPLFPADAAYAIAPPSDTAGAPNPINGHEQAVAQGSPGWDDLQYACIFPMEPLACTPDNAAACACNADERGYARPLCRYENASGDGVQVFDKAYPAPRLLEVLAELGEDAVLASACPKQVNPSGSNGGAEDGYHPAVNAMADALTASLTYRCLPAPIPADDAGRIACNVFEATPGTADCACEASGRRSVSAEVTAMLALKAAEYGLCQQGACALFCACEVPQHEGSALTSCQNDQAGPGDPGFCYLDGDADHPVGELSLVQRCTADANRRLRFTGTNTPAAESIPFMTCANHYAEGAR